MAELPIIRRQSRFIRRTSSLGEGFWRSAAKYYLLGEEGRPERCFIYLAGKGVFNMVNYAAPFVAGSQVVDERGALEGSMDCPDANLQTLHWTTGLSTSGSTQANGNTGSGNQQSEKQCCGSSYTDHKKTCVEALLNGLNQTERKIMKFLTDYLISPPHNCIRTWQWMQQGIRVRESDESFKHVLSKYKCWLRLLRYEELYEFYKDKVKLYTAIDKEFDDVFWPLDESLNKLEFYGERQFYGAENFYDFMVVLYKQQSGQGGKKGNSIWIKGPPDCAKSFFVESLKSLQVVYGGCSVLNKTNGFGIASLVDVRLAVLDEFNFDPIVYTDRIKLLLSGNECQAQVKFKDDGSIRTTPVILMSNGDILPDNDIFNARVMKYEFHKIAVDDYVPLRGKEPDVVHPFYTRNLHPECFIEYWKKNGIWGTKFNTDIILTENEEQ